MACNILVKDILRCQKDKDDKLSCMRRWTEVVKERDIVNRTTKTKPPLP